MDVKAGVAKVVASRLVDLEAIVEEEAIVEVAVEDHAAKGDVVRVDGGRAEIAGAEDVAMAATSVVVSGEDQR